jgi:ubiquitin thioesterase OTU1
MIAIRRNVDADNSCLFSSLGYLLERNQYDDTTKFRFRSMVVNMLENTTTYDNILELPKPQYIDYILDPSNWGGAIEIKIISDLYNIMVVCFDVKTGRTDIYNQDKNYNNCIYMLYNGIHYDPLVVNYPDMDSMSDITIFNSQDIQTFNNMKNLIEYYRNQKDYFDFNSMECEICKIQIKNQEDAYNHSMESNHWNYKQI